MASSDTLTFDDVTPHRAVLSELGGGAKENNAKSPPDPVKHPTAQDFNQFSRQLEAVNRVIPLALVWVRFNAGVPIIDRVMAPGSLVVPSDFTPVDNGPGDTTISWTTGPGGKLPGAVGALARQTDDTEIDRCRSFLTTAGSNPAARVKTKLGATGTDANYCLEIY